MHQVADSEVQIDVLDGVVAADAVPLLGDWWMFHDGGVCTAFRYQRRGGCSEAIAGSTMISYVLVLAELLVRN